MRVLIIENFHASPLGNVGIALEEAQAEITLRRPWQGDALPDHDGFDAIVVLGGEQSALDDEKYPYLPELVALMRTFGAADKPALGICLGSQLLARAHGGTNRLNAAREFGWREVRRTEAAADDPVLSAAAEAFPIFQWHSDTFTLPENAVRLATNETAENQCFRVGRASYGMQFHFEANRDVVETWVKGFPDTVDRMDPDWLPTYPQRAETEGKTADAAGLAIARAWVRLIGA
ncbi:type 1 glutamine amidotransferase [Rhizobium sp. TRM95796]|uniref:type 1 glutamine amidotransferase n=1 Tax=Rhizobium sp. TRM95796 TaxID=2979862 RepID=UPI0021E790D6|nr:type 1 glutamine amidotransferase [Rhizobium sp. TRM95796]MCV3768307.1 type 1 glutamine amidotransferase [Rhizobium sp. TRM95796]